MPQIFHNTGKVAITLEELVPEHFPTYDALKKALRRSEIRGYGVQRLMRGGNERQLLVDFDTLPRQIKESFKDPRVAEHPLEPFYKLDKDAVEFFGAFKYSNGLYLPDETQDKYIINASVLQGATLLKEARERERLNKMGSLRGVMGSICFDVKTFNPILKKTYGVEHSLPENERRFSEKFNDFLNIGYESLVNKNLGNKNALVATDETVSLLNNIFSEPAHKPSYAEVARQYESFLSGYVEVINSKTGEIYDPKEFKKLSKNSIYNYLSSWQNRIATHTVRSADRQKNMGKYKPAFSFEQPKYAGSLLSIDDRQPPFKYGGGQRAWFYLGEDVASQAITVWVSGTTKEGMILDFYRQLVRNYHELGLQLPAELECESSLNSSFKDTFLREGTMFQYVKIEANNARGKSIESQVNRQLRYIFEKTEPGWQGRPGALDESNQMSPVKDVDLSYQQIIDMALLKIEEFNNSPHPHEKGLSRWEYFLERQHPNLKPTNYKAFIKNLGFKTESSCNVGKIRCNNELYVLALDGQLALGDDLINIMKQVEGKDVDVYWLDTNDGSLICAYVYLRGDDRIICEALPIPKPNKARVEQTDEDRQKYELFSKYVSTVEGYNSRQRKALDRVAVIKTDKQPENKPKTLFKINGLSSSRLQENDPIKEVNGHEFETINGVEIMPEVPTDDIDNIPTDTPFRPSLKDRF